MLGEKSAEFVNYKKGDIIFNAAQTEQILKNGKITSGAPRGKAFADGTVPAAGKAFSSGSGKITGSGSVKTSSTGSSSSNSSSNSTSEKAAEVAKEFLEVFDWIEIAIDRIERVIKRFATVADSVYKTFADRNKALKSQMSEVSKEITLQQKAYDRYIKQANSVGLSAKYQEQVKNGTIDISTITDEDLADKIGQFQEWYEKALDCKDAIDELSESLSDLYQQAFDNISTQFDGIITNIEFQAKTLDNYIAEAELKGKLVSENYYKALASTEQKVLAQLQNERAALEKSLSEAVNSGAVQEGSEAWYGMVNAIDDVTLAIQESNNALLEYNNSIRDIQWQIFDLIADRISKITSESDFLIDLMSNKDSYDDSGQITDAGMATMGLHGVNYNTYMAQADRYAEEMKRIQAEIANDPSNLTLIDRRDELLELQQESILAAENEKKAIADMVENGINLQIKSMQELIKSYKDALDSQKDLYDYQKKIAKQAKEITGLEKQILAYQGDDSEEARAKKQTLQTSLDTAKENLEETQYTRYVSDQKKMLDALFLEYETILNQRLDNIDALIIDVINEVNNNATRIGTTLTEQATNVGYTLTNEMRSIWNSNDKVGNILSAYSSNFSSTMTTVQSTISGILAGVNSMIAQNNAAAAAQAAAAAAASVANSSSSKSTTSSSSSNSSSSSSSGSSSSTTSPSTTTKAGNFFISKKDAYPKNQLNINTSIVDRLKYFDFDSSTDARAKYYKSMGLTGTYYSTEAQNVNMISWMKKNGYRSGAKSITSDQMAWTNEHTPETIIRKSDGAILTPLKQGDTVLNTKGHDNIWSMANNPEKFIRDITGGSLEGISSIQNSSAFNGDINMQIDLPNVTDYESFKSAMQNDKNVQNWIKSITIDRAFGGSSLKQNRYK